MLQSNKMNKKLEVTINFIYSSDSKYPNDNIYIEENLKEKI